MTQDLDAWRQEIRAIDQEIIRITARRMELALKIGRYKAENQLPVKDFRVEKEIIEKARVMASGLGLAPDFIEDLMTLLMGYSVQEQNKLHQAIPRVADVRLKQVLIVGGLGRMGRWFAQYFQSIGFQVAIHDLKTDELPGHLQRHERLDESLDRYEVILLTCPIEASAGLLQDIGRQKPPGMVIETASLKSPVQDAITDLSRQGTRIASIHPMFGPDTDLLLDKNILICAGEGLCSEEAASLYFHSTSANLVTLPLEDHDQEMLITLSLVHVLNLMFGIALRDTALPVGETRRRGGSSFLQQIRTTQAIFSENHDLYFEIQAMNPYGPRLFANLGTILERLRGVVAASDREGFLEEMVSVRRYLESTPSA